MATPIEEPLLEKTLEALPGWQGSTDRIWREVHLPADLDAELRHQVEVDATALGHLPQVEAVEGGTRFTLTTQEVGAVSELDVALASHISDLAWRLTKDAPVPDEPGVHAVRTDDAEVVIEDSEAKELHTQPERAGKFQVRF